MDLNIVQPVYSLCIGILNISKTQNSSHVILNSIMRGKNSQCSHGKEKPHGVVIHKLHLFFSARNQEEVGFVEETSS
jgi:hypothetical protein